MDLAQVSLAWDVDHMLAVVYGDEEYARAATALHVDLMRDYDPHVVVDSFGLFACLAARILHAPLATVLQGNFHPASSGFLWWAGERPAGLPDAAPVINKVAAEFGVAPVARCVDLLAGDLCLIVGTPETDPLPAARVTYVGQIVWQKGNATLPDWVLALSRDKPVVWVYSGNPRYAGAPTPIDSIVVIRSAIAALADTPMHVVLTTGYPGGSRRSGNPAVELPSRRLFAGSCHGPALRSDGPSRWSQLGHDRVVRRHSGGNHPHHNGAREQRAPSGGLGRR